MRRVSPPLLLTLALALVVARNAPADVAAPLEKWRDGGCYPEYCLTAWYSSPAVADLDGDGGVEVVWGNVNDVVALRGGDGALRTRVTNDWRSWPDVAIADIDGDGKLEVAVGRNNEVTVYRPQASGGTLLFPVLWTRAPFSGGEVRTLALADLESDGRLDVVVGLSGDTTSRQLNAFDPAGNQRTGWPARHSGEVGSGGGMFNENVAVGDLDKDGYKEVIGPNDSPYILALDRNGNQLGTSAIYNAASPVGPKVWSQVGVHVSNAVDLRGYAICGTEPRVRFTESPPLIADLDGDGQREIVVVGNVYNCALPYTDLYHMPFILKADRSRWAASGFDWTAIPSPRPGSAPLSEDYNVIEKAMPNPALADLDGDGLAEILYPSYDGKLHALWLDKTEHGSWPFVVPGPGSIRFASEPVVADLDNDGQAEVIFTSWADKASNAVGSLYVLDSSGRQLYAVPLPSPPSGFGNGGLGAPTLADIDGDGELEVVAGTTNSGVVAYDLPGTTSARVLWRTGRGSFARSGAFDPVPLRVDLSTTKTNGRSSVVTGGVVTYTITVANAGPAGVTGAAVDDSFPAVVTGVSWTCGAAGGGSCGAASGSGDIHATVNLPRNGSVTFVASGTLSQAARGTLANTATASVPSGYGDPVGANNAATDADPIIVSTDVALTKTDGAAFAVPGQPVVYTIVASNAGPNGVDGVTVSDAAPSSLLSPTWTCVGSSGGSCGSAGGSGVIADTASLPVGGTVTYTLAGTLDSAPASLVNTATVVLPSGYVDPVPSNNSATDSDTLLCGDENALVSDGRETSLALAAGATRWLLLSALPGASYSLELEDPLGRATLTPVVFRGDDGCTGTSTATTRDTTALAPALGSGVRLSFAGGGASPSYRVRLTNGPSPATYRVAASETTIFSPAWSTNGSYNTYYSLQNTTSATITATISFARTDGTSAGEATLTIPGGLTTSTNTAALAVPRNATGTVRLRHDGPPAALLTDAAIANFSLRPPYVQPVRFRPLRETR